MDLTYATIPMFGGETKRLYRENQLAYIISKESRSVNHIIYAVDTDFWSCILKIDDNQQTSVQLIKPTHKQPEEVTIAIWTMYFDGASAQSSAGTGVVLISPSKENIHLSYKIDFKTMNNVTEYGALLLGFKASKEMGIMCMKILGDADLIIQ